MTLALAVGLAGLAALPGCAIFDEGQQQSLTFVTPVPASLVMARAEVWFGQHGYVVRERTDVFARGERTRATAAGSEIDILSVQLQPAPDGTQVQLQGVTDRVESGIRRRAPQVSPEAAQDVQSLADALMARVPSPPGV